MLGKCSIIELIPAPFIFKIMLLFFSINVFIRICLLYRILFFFFCGTVHLEPLRQPLFFYVKIGFFKIGSCELFSPAGFKL
jgi:hypothetical protein